MAWWKYARPGQKVVGLSRAQSRCRCSWPVIGDGESKHVGVVYTVVEVFPYPKGCTGFAVKLAELFNPWGCCPAGFEIIQDTKTQVEALKRLTIGEKEKA